MKKAVFVVGAVVLGGLAAGGLLLIGCGPARPAADLPVEDAYYVAPNGSDENPGTRDRPWRTIQHAAETAQAGDTVIIRAGTYSEAVQFRHSGREGSPITFQSYPGEEVTIQGGEWFGLGLLDVDWVVVDGLRVFGAGTHGILLSNANHNVIRNCESGNNGWDGVMITAKNGEGDSSYNTISGCTIHDNTHEGVYVQSGWQQERVVGNVIEYNLITGSGDEAVQNNRWDQSTYDPPFPTGTIIRGNVIHDNHGEWGMMQLYGDDLLVEDNLLYDNSGTDYTGGIAYGRGDGAVIRNNVLVNNDGQASYDAAIFVGEASNLTVVHNTIVGHGGFGIFLKLISGEALVANNLVYGTESVPIQLDEGTEDVRPTHNLIDADPLFVNPDEMDFHLRAGSPAIDAGLDVGVGADADGKPRPQGDGVDIGAYEFGG